MNYGVKNCIWTSLGDITANFIQGTLVIFVIGSFLSDNSTYLNAFKWIGIIYLVYLAYDIYKSRPESINSNEHYGKSIFSFVKDGFLVAGTSPKAWLFFTTIFPSFIDFNSNYVLQFIILIITYMVLDFITLIGYAVLANKAIVWIKANPKIINITIKGTYQCVFVQAHAFFKKCLTASSFIPLLSLSRHTSFRIHSGALKT